MKQRIALLEKRLMELRGLIDDLIDLIATWQDENRTYTPAEQQLDMRLDCPIRLG